MLKGIELLLLLGGKVVGYVESMGEAPTACYPIPGENLGDTDPRPTIVKDPTPPHLTPAMLRMDASSRKYQSTQRNWRRYDGTHFKKNKRIK